MDEHQDEHFESDAPSGGPAREPLRDKAILALLQQPSIPRAAEAAGVSERTIHRWLDDPQFMLRFKKARRQVFGQAIARIQNLSTTAATTLAKVMVDERAPCHARVSASIAILRFGREAIELDDLQERIEALEAKLEEQGKSVIDVVPEPPEPPEPTPEPEPERQPEEMDCDEPESADEDD